MKTAVVVDGVTKYFGDERALDNVSLEIREGEILVLLGPNGSGKTTLMRCIVGVLRPNRGRVLVYGREPYNDLDVKGLIGYVPQEHYLYENLTGFENYLYYAALEGVDDRTALERLERFKDIFDLGEWFYKKKLKTYSGGMIRKTNIVVALSHDPKVFVMDEPTAGLDPNARRGLWDTILKLREEDRTIILATHLFEDAEVLADRVVIMYRGRIREVDEVEALKEKVGYKFAVEVEFASEPSEDARRVVESYDGSRVLRVGYTYRILTNDAKLVERLEEDLRNVKSRILRLEARRISLGDVYFLLTGVMLK